MTRDEELTDPQKWMNISFKKAGIFNCVLVQNLKSIDLIEHNRRPCLDFGSGSDSQLFSCLYV